MKDRYAAVIIILLVLLFAVVGLALLARHNAVSLNQRAEEQEFIERCEQLNNADVTIYWIGSFPEELSHISSRVKVVSEISEETMPMKSPEFHTIERDADGNIVKERIPVTYTKYLYIVINRVTLSDDQYRVIRDCVKDNGVRTIIMGGNAIKAYRDYLLLPVARFGEDDNMAYSLEKGSKSHALGDVSSSDALVRYMLGDMTEDGDRSIEDSTDNSQG